MFSIAHMIIVWMLTYITLLGMLERGVKNLFANGPLMGQHCSSSSSIGAPGMYGNASHGILGMLP